MELDAAWHDWFWVALAVMIDGMLAVFAQCGCCHHFHPFCVVILLPFHLICLFNVALYPLLGFSFGLLPVLLYVIGFVKSILHMILHGLMFCCFSFWYYMVYVLWDYELYFGGGSYSSVYVPPPLFVSPVILVVYIPMFFIFLSYYIWYTYFLVHITLGFIFCNCVSFNHNLMNTFGGCIHMYFIICSYMCILRYVHLIYIIIYDIII